MSHPESRAGGPHSTWASGPTPSKKPSQLPDSEESHPLLPGIPTCNSERRRLVLQKGGILQGPLLALHPGAGAREGPTSLPHAAGRSAPGSSAPVMCVLLPIRKIIPRGRKGPPGAHSAHLWLVYVTSLVLSAQVRSEAQRSRAPLLRSQKTRSSICRCEDNERPDGGCSSPMGAHLSTPDFGGPLVKLPQWLC